MQRECKNVCSTPKPIPVTTMCMFKLFKKAVVIDTQII